MACVLVLVGEVAAGAVLVVVGGNVGGGWVNAVGVGVDWTEISLSGVCAAALVMDTPLMPEVMPEASLLLTAPSAVVRELQQPNVLPSGVGQQLPEKPAHLGWSLH
jgi:hypothetical protein